MTFQWPWMLRFLMPRFLIAPVSILVLVGGLCLLNNYRLFLIDYLLFYLLLKLSKISSLLIKDSCTSYL
jgi:hypothetical protein